MHARGSFPPVAPSLTTGRAPMLALAPHSAAFGDISTCVRLETGKRVCAFSHGQRPTLDGRPATHSRSINGAYAATALALCTAVGCRQQPRSRSRGISVARARVRQEVTAVEGDVVEVTDVQGDVTNGRTSKSPRERTKVPKPPRAAAGRTKTRVQPGDDGLLDPVLSRPARGARAPTPHRINDTWYDRVSNTSEQAAAVVKRHRRRAAAGLQATDGIDPGIMHCSQGQMGSLRKFLDTWLPERIRRVAHLATLSDTSIVLVPSGHEPDTLRMDAFNVLLTNSTKPTRLFELNQELQNNGAAPVLAKNLCHLQGDGLADDDPEAEELAQQAKRRFKVHLRPELMYYKSPRHTTEYHVASQDTLGLLAMVPAEVTDAVTGLSQSIDVEMGLVPLTEDTGHFYSNGSKKMLVHRIQKLPKPVKRTKERLLLVDAENADHHLGRPQKVDPCVEYVRQGEVLIRGAPQALRGGVPADIFLQAMGRTDNDFRRMKNFGLWTSYTSRSREEAINYIFDAWAEKRYGGAASVERMDKIGWFEGNFKTFLSARHIGELGRRLYNERLGLNLTEQHLTITDLLAAVDFMLDGNDEVDDLESFDHKGLRPVGVVLDQQARKWMYDIEHAGIMNIHVDMTKCTAEESGGLAQALRRVYNDNNAHACDDYNQLYAVAQSRKMTLVDERGLDSIKRIQAIRLVHGSEFGRVCPIETGDGQSCGLVKHLAQGGQVTPEGQVFMPVQRVVGGRRQIDEPWEYLSSQESFQCRIVGYDTAYGRDGLIRAPLKIGESKASAGPPALVNVRHLDNFSSVGIEQVDYIDAAPPLGLSVGLIPFLEHDDANRMLMGAKMQNQAIPPLFCERPIVGTGMEATVASSSAQNQFAETEGQVLRSEGNGATVVGTFIHKGQTAEADKRYPEGWQRTTLELRTEEVNHRFTDSAKGQRGTLTHHIPVAQPGQRVYARDMLASGNTTNGGELAIGSNIVVAYMPYEGYNYEDAIVISKRMVREDILTSVYMDVVDVPLERRAKSYVPSPGEVPTLERLKEVAPKNAHTLDEEGFVRVGTWVEEQDTLAVVWRQTPQGMKRFIAKAPTFCHGRVIAVMKITNPERKSERILRIYVASRKRVEVGDKLAGRHGNKGIVSTIVEERDMPYLPDGTPVDICLNPLGVPSRMNVGQIFECLMGMAGRWTGNEYRVAPFDEMFADDASRGLVFEALDRANKELGPQYNWLLDPSWPGKSILFDGRTGHCFDQPIAVGVTYFLKLHHQVTKKIDSGIRITSNSKLKASDAQEEGKNHKPFRGFRIGEMEVSALVGHGASAMLQECLSIKSDKNSVRSNLAWKSMLDGDDVSVPRGAASQVWPQLQREIAACAFGMDAREYAKRRKPKADNFEFKPASSAISRPTKPSSWGTFSPSSWKPLPKKEADMIESYWKRMKGLRDGTAPDRPKMKADIPDWGDWSDGGATADIAYEAGDDGDDGGAAELVDGGAAELAVGGGAAEAEMPQPTGDGGSGDTELVWEEAGEVDDDRGNDTANSDDYTGDDDDESLFSFDSAEFFEDDDDGDDYDQV